MLKLKESEKILDKEEIFKVVDLFSGTGAFSIVFEESNLCKTIFANDFDINSKNIHTINNLDLEYGDINDKTIQSKIPECDILCGGFPCQPFSQAGEKKGFSDDRSKCFWSLVDIINKTNPKCILLENVKNLKTHNNGNSLKTVLNSITNYNIFYDVIDASDTGIPQHRERLYFVGFRKDLNIKSFDFTFNKINIKINEWNGIDRTKKQLPKYYYTNTSSIFDKLEKDVKNKNSIYQYRRTFVRENMNNVCPTLTANMGTGGHNVPIILDDFGIRKLTPRECLNLQGFPDNYKFGNISDANLYKLAGNAVCLNVIRILTQKILATLFKNNNI